MSYSSKYKPEITTSAEEAPAEELAQPIINIPPEFFDSEKEEPLYSEQYMLSELHKAEKKYPGILQAVKPYLPKIKVMVKMHLKSAVRYYQWEKNNLKTRQADSPDADADAADAADTSEALEDPSPKKLVLPPVPECDASVKVFMSADNMFGFIYCLSPIGRGMGMDKDMLKAAVENYGINYGIIQLALSRIFVKKHYFCLYPIAVGTPPVKGDDGIVTEHFPRIQKMHLQEDERGVIDYKNLHIFTDVKKGDIICGLTPPTRGQDGCDVLGHPVPPTPGKMPNIPKGRNTLINDDNTALIAEINGVLSYQRNVFRVESRLTIPGNIDSSTGNIDFTGDVLINGDVLGGFKVKARGNITVMGMAEGATLISGEDIIIKEGMNGSGSGVLNANGNIHSRFIEQAEVSAAGNVVAETIINCQIIAGDSIFATTGKGIIIGGKLFVKNCVEAKRIGGTSNTKTFIKLAHSMLDKENLEFLKSELSNTKETLRMLEKNLTYLKSLPTLPPNKAELLNTLTEQKLLYENMSKNLQDKIDDAYKKSHDFKGCYVHGDKVHPITEITLNHSRKCIQETTIKCNVYYVDDGLVLGTF